MNFLTIFWTLLTISTSAFLYYKACRLFDMVVDKQREIDEYFDSVRDIYMQKVIKEMAKNADE